MKPILVKKRKKKYTSFENGTVKTLRLESKEENIFKEFVTFDILNLLSCHYKKASDSYRSHM